MRDVQYIGDPSAYSGQVCFTYRDKGPQFSNSHSRLADHGPAAAGQRAQLETVSPSNFSDGVVATCRGNEDELVTTRSLNCPHMCTHRGAIRGASMTLGTAVLMMKRRACHKTREDLDQRMAQPDLCSCIRISTTTPRLANEPHHQASSNSTETRRQNVTKFLFIQR